MKRAALFLLAVTFGGLVVTSIEGAETFRMQFAPINGMTIAKGEIFSREYTTEGPIDGVRLLPGVKVITTAGLQKYYGVFWHEFYEIDVASWGVRRISFPEGFSYPTSITYDQREGRMLIAASGPAGGGGIYAFDLENQAWTLIATSGSRFEAIMYDNEDHFLWGVTAAGEVYILNRDGQQISYYWQNVPIPFSIISGNYQMELVDLGEGRAALLIEREFGWPFQPESSHQRIFVLDRDGGAELTYSHDLPVWPPVEARPTVRMISPAPNSVVPSAEEFVFKVHAEDPDGTVEQVTLYSGFDFIAEIERSGNGEFVFENLKLPPGGHRITVQVRDNEGLIANSDPITFTIDGPSTENTTITLNFWPVRGLSVLEGELMGRTYLPTGPIGEKTLLPGMPVVYWNSEESTYYGTYWHRVYKVDASTGKFMEVPVTGVPELSWPTSLTYDGNKHRLLLLSMGGAEGFIYGYSFQDEAWSVVASMGHTDYYAIAADYRDGSIYVAGNAEIAKFSSDGERISSMPMPPLPQPLDPVGYTAVLVSEGEKLYLLVEPREMFSFGSTAESRIYEIDFEKKTATQTYRKIWRQWPPVNAVPRVTIRAPQSGVVLQNTNAIRLEASVTDLDGDVVSLNFYSNGENLGRGILTGTNGTVRTYVLELKNAPTGVYNLTARAIDFEAASGVSAPVQFSVIGTPPANVFTMDFYKVDDHGSPIETKRYTPQGPLDEIQLLPGMRVVRAQDEIFGVLHTWSFFRVNPQTGLTEEVAVNGVTPEARGPVGVAYDWRRDRVVLATTGGEGFLYAYSIESNRWSTLRDLNNHDLVSLHYHEANDSLYGLAVMSGNPTDGPGVFQFDADGNEIGYISLPRLPYILGQYSYRGEVTSAGDKLAVLIEIGTPGMHLFNESRIYMVDPQTGVVELTYLRSWTENEFPRETPFVKMLAPANGTRAIIGEATKLEAAAFPGGYTEFEFLVNGEVMGDAEHSSDVVNLTRGHLMWTPTHYGTNVITARVRTWQGLVGISEPISVIVVDRPPDFIVATRDLPEVAAGGQPITVQITVSPGGAVNAYALQDFSPTNWRITSVSHDGVFDERTSSVKFGPFTDNQARTVSYTVVPSVEVGDEEQFRGDVSANGNRHEIRGDTTLRRHPGYHPADRSPANYAIDLQEVTAYASAWKAGEWWPEEPNPIPMSYVTRAGMIWRQGEEYRFDASAVEGPFWWVPTGGVSSESIFSTRSATRTVRSIGTGVFEVTLELPAILSSSALAIEEYIPSGAVASGMSEGGVAVAGNLRWGPWIGSRPESVRYTLATTRTLTTLRGAASIDGAESETSGSARIEFPKLNASVSNGTLTLNFDRPAQGTVVLESAEDLSGPWEVVGTNQTSAVALAMTSGNRFYRLRLE